MQDDNELHAQSILTVAAFTEWAEDKINGVFLFGLKYLNRDELNTELNKYLSDNGFSPDTKLIDGEYQEFLVIKE